MRNKNIIWKKTTAVALSLVMAVGLIPAVSRPLTVEAATNSASSNSIFADKETLMMNYFNLNGGTVQKVAFGIGGDGDEKQTWYIAGYDKNAGNLVLMCNPNMPFIKSTTFCYGYPNARFSVDASEGLSIDTCEYTDGTQVSEVGMNHYGLSKIRAQLKEREQYTEIFSSAEQELMEETTIYTYDKYNDKTYSTTDKLYAAHVYKTQSTANPYAYDYYLIVGQNSKVFLNSGLKIQLKNSSNTSSNPYSSHSYSFWLRTPGEDYIHSNPNKAANYKPSGSPEWYYLDYIDKSSQAVVPAFALDLSSVLFASEVPVETSGYGSGTELANSDEPWVFRLDDNNYGKIKSTIEYTMIETNEEIEEETDEEGGDETGEEIGEEEVTSQLGVKVTKNKNDASTLYLCAQGTNDNGDWYFAEPIKETRTFRLTDLGNGATKDNCQVWIETTADRVTYAKMAETVSAPTASVKVGTYTANKNVSFSTIVEGATIYYTMDGSDPSDADNESRREYTTGEELSVTGKPGETVTTTIKAIAVTKDGEESRVATYKYVIRLPHVHAWDLAWTSDSNGHWNKCTNANCTITNNNEKNGYAAHTMDDGTVTKEPTATETGVKTYKCSVCGYVMQTETLPATGGGSTATGTSSTAPAAKNTILTVDSEKCKVKVTSDSATNPTVAYTGTTDANAATVKIPDAVTVDNITYNVTSVAANAFANNKKITKVTIGKNITSIGKNAFKNCKKLKTVSMGANVTTIGDSVFYKCTALTSITIPKKVNKIGKQAFYGCKKLKSINIKTTKLTSKKVGSKAFKGIYSKATIKVPSSKLSSYKKMLKAKGVSSKAKIKK